MSFDRLVLVFLLANLSIVSADSGLAQSNQRVSRGLLVLYDFSEREGNTIHDRSGTDRPLNLEIRNPAAVEWHDDRLTIRSSVLISSSEPARKIIERVRKTGELTVEAWIKPANASQDGPSRIVSLSADPGQRNFTLAQEGDQYDVRFRSTSTCTNGMPSTSTSSRSLQSQTTHVVFTREGNGKADIFINGRQQASRQINGDLSNWSRKFQLCLANELTRDRPWRGDIYLVAFYDRALTLKEIRQNFAVRASSEKPATVRRVAAKDPKAARANKTKSETPVVAKSVTLPGGIKLERVDFERHVMGVVGRVGCNGGSCHGSFQGRGGFRLSLFSYDFDRDFEALTERVDAGAPDDSYLLDKPTLKEDHGGGRRLTPGTWQYEVFHQWIADGARREPGSGVISEIETVPREARFRRPGETVQLKVMATFADGSRENVSPFCDFRVNDDYVAQVSNSGKLTSQRPGDTAVVITYRDHVLTSRVLVTSPAKTGFRFPRLVETNYIDREVFAKLRKLNIAPSNHSTDGDFLRRVYIDTIGRLPMPEEARKFLADKDPKKRNRMIDQLLDHPLHAALWATKFSDITGNNTDALQQPREKRSKMWHDWFRKRLAENQPYDEIVRGVLCATSREGDDPERWIEDTTAIEETALTSFETSYADRDTLDLFWTRNNLSLEQMGEQTAAALLGVRLQCAQCHKHPYDRWTQADYRSYANIFGQVKFGASPEAKEQIDEENKRRKAIKDKKKKLANLREVFVDVDRPRRLNHPDRKESLPSKALGGPEFEMDGDARESLFAWLRRPDNPYFARSFVNRVWEHYFGIGIVDPVDDFSVANPPSNEKLLDALARDFIDHRFDIRHLERTILRSRTYQLSSIPNETNLQDRRNYARSYPRRMMAEVVVDVVNSALGTTDRFDRDAPEGSQAIEIAASRVQDSNLRYAFQIFGRPKRTAVCDCERSAEPSLPQSLYLMTDSNIMRKIRDGRVKQVLNENTRRQKLRNKEISDTELSNIVDELFLATLTRLPDTRERLAAIENIRRKEGSESALVDIVWALINTREFILNH